MSLANYLTLLGVLLLIGIAIGCVVELMKRYWKRNRP